MKTLTTCKEDGCNGSVHVQKHGLCKVCYGKLTQRIRKGKDVKCINPGCQNQSINKKTPGFCWTCYNRLRKHGTVDKALTSHERRKGEIKKEILAYIINYKCMYDGISPSTREIASAISESQPTVLRYLDFLSDDGAISILEKNDRFERRIMVTGGKWTYTNTQNEDAAE